jgi:hypothetical protein
MTTAKMVYSNLARITEVDVETGAVYRQQAQEILADPTVQLPVKQWMADRLISVNHDLEMQVVGPDESY